MAFLPEYYCSIYKNKIIILLFDYFMEKKKIKDLDGVVVDSGKNCVAHYTIYAISAALFCLVNFAYCNYFAIHSFESPVKLSIHCISYFKHCSHKYPQELYFRNDYLNLG
jgi:hypothetical protein